MAILTCKPEQRGGASPGEQWERTSTVAFVTDLQAAPSTPTRPRRPSKVDSIRPTYGFDDVSLAPGMETVEPSDVDTSVDLAGLKL